jgi:4'-phosphopantetheinyl transferase
MPADAAAPAAAVDIWTVGSTPLDANDLARMSALLTSEEAARGARFVRPRDREAFVLARALVRTQLSRYAPTAPADWRFMTNAHDCPFVVDAQAGSPPLHFNLSHTDGLVAVAIVRGHRVGVDVEDVTRAVLEAVPERHFAPDEVRDLRRLPADEQPRVFFDYWTLKEAYIKARGMGLALPLDQFAFALHAGTTPTIRFAPGFDDLPSRWQFRQAWPTPAHRLALAIERTGADLPVILHHLTAASLVP